MRGLDPRIHAVAGAASARREDKGGRIKPAMTTLTCVFIHTHGEFSPKTPAQVEEGRAGAQ